MSFLASRVSQVSVFYRTLGCLVLCLAASSASATKIFDFNASNLGVIDSSTSDIAYDSVGMTVGTIGVTITAFKLENNGSGSITDQVQIQGGGTGVYVSSGNNLGVSSMHPSLSGDSHSLDGGDSGLTTSSDPDEGLLFSFTRAIDLTYINFDSFSGSDDFNLTVDGVSVLVDYNSGDSSPLVTNVAGQSDEFFFNGVHGTEFLFWADGDSDSFRIDRMWVVPEPATLALFSFGLAGIGAMRRRKLLT